MNTILHLLFAHLDTHPQAEIQDAVKFLYQASFGGGHMIPDAAVSYAYLCREAASISGDRDMPLSEPMGNFVRLDLAALQKISPKTLNAMFVASAKDAPQDKSDFIALLDAFLESDYFEKELLKAANRAFCHGFYYEHPTVNEQLFNMRDEHPTQEFVMRIVDYDKETKLAKIEQRNYFKLGDQIEVFSPHHDNLCFTVKKLYNEDMEEIDVANHPMEILYVEIPYQVLSNDMGRKVRNV